MNVILLRDVRGVGQSGEVKYVADGYAMNYLFPHRLAEPATPEKIARLEAQKAQKEKERAAAQEELAQKAAALRGKRIALQSRATEKGGLFKTITPADIARAIASQLGAGIPEDSIVLQKPIKTTGTHSATVATKNGPVEFEVEVAAA